MLTGMLLPATLRHPDFNVSGTRWRHQRGFKGFSGGPYYNKISNLLTPNPTESYSSPVRSAIHVYS
jgi:hypothetical protein